MNVMKKSLALLLVFALALSCFPLGAVTAFAAENEETQPPSEPVDTTLTEATETVPAETEEAPTEESTPETEPTEEVIDKGPMMFSASPASDDDSGSSGSEVGDGGDGSGNAAGDGSSNMIAVGVTMQVVYYRYDECYNRYNSHGNVIETVQTGKAIPWNDTGKDTGETMTTVFDTFTITPNTFIVKARWDSYPYVYHFPTENIVSDGCTFTWTGFTSYWFSYENPGGKADTYPRIVRNEKNGSKAIEDYLAQIILGSNYGAWDKLDIAKGETVATDSSLFAATLKYLGASDQANQNYLDSYFGKLSVTQDGDTLIPTIIWSYVVAENLGGTNRIYTIGDVADSASSNDNWLYTTYTSAANCNKAIIHEPSWNFNDFFVYFAILYWVLIHSQVFLDGSYKSMYAKLCISNKVRCVSDAVIQPLGRKMPHPSGRGICGFTESRACRLPHPRSVPDRAGPFLPAAAC